MLLSKWPSRPNAARTDPHQAGIVVGLMILLFSLPLPEEAPGDTALKSAPLLAVPLDVATSTVTRSRLGCDIDTGCRRPFSSAAGRWVGICTGEEIWLPI